MTFQKHFLKKLNVPIYSEYFQKYILQNENTKKNNFNIYLHNFGYIILHILEYNTVLTSSEDTHMQFLKDFVWYLQEKHFKKNASTKIIKNIKVGTYIFKVI